jgi:tetratricopeptide (TPR) repeat protein
MQMKRFLIGAALGAALTLTSAAQVWAAAPNGAEALLENAQAVMNADPALALQQAEEAALLAPGAGHGAGLARAQWLKGEALLRLNRPGEAQTALENALGALRPQADAILYAKVLVGIANCHAADGQTGQATTELRRAFDLFRKAGDLRSQATTLIDLGALYEESGRPHEALDAYARAAAVYRADSAVSLAAHNNRANVLKAVGRYEEARDEFKEMTHEGSMAGTTVLTRKDGSTIEFTYVAGATIVAGMQVFVSVGAIT